MRLLVTAGRFKFGDPGDKCAGGFLSPLVIASGTVIVMKHLASGRAGTSSGSGLPAGPTWMCGCFPSPASVGARARATGLSWADIELALRARGDERKPDDLAGLGTSSVSSCTPTPEMCRMRGCR